METWVDLQQSTKLGEDKSIERTLWTDSQFSSVSLSGDDLQPFIWWNSAVLENYRFTGRSMASKTGIQRLSVVFEIKMKINILYRVFLINNSWMNKNNKSFISKFINFCNVQKQWLPFPTVFWIGWDRDWDGLLSSFLYLLFQLLKIFSLLLIIMVLNSIKVSREEPFHFPGRIVLL